MRGGGRTVSTREPLSQYVFLAGAVSRKPMGSPAPAFPSWTLFSSPGPLFPYPAPPAAGGHPETPRLAATSNHEVSRGRFRVARTREAAAPGPPQMSSPPRAIQYLLIDTQGVPYTVLVDEGAQGESGANGASAQKKSYSCPVCSRVFEYMSLLQRHSVTHSEVKPFECNTCGKAFKLASHLARHLTIHQAGDRRPHVCSLCLRRFREAGELAQHSRRHLGERPFQCPHCPSRYMEESVLQKHIRWKHP
ncbi:hypothetical protein MC885_010149 [Smutsia gigantea]|nr:hypothetical protein MC885_010149 [Smutsia gigantea]